MPAKYGHAAQSLTYSSSVGRFVLDAIDLDSRQGEMASAAAVADEGSYRDAVVLLAQPLVPVDQIGCNLFERGRALPFDRADLGVDLALGVGQGSFQGGGLLFELAPRLGAAA